MFAINKAEEARPPNPTSSVIFPFLGINIRAVHIISDLSISTPESMEASSLVMIRRFLVALNVRLLVTFKFEVKSHFE